MSASPHCQADPAQLHTEIDCPLQTPGPAGRA